MFEVLVLAAETRGFYPVGAEGVSLSTKESFRVLELVDLFTPQEEGVFHLLGVGKA